MKLDVMQMDGVMQIDGVIQMNDFMQQVIGGMIISFPGSQVTPLLQYSGNDALPPEPIE